ncbi:MAG: 1-acyl-sn-glycerol-3-phosphate acyltransferase [Deltaproteobacteria bacterium]|nr:1-acyl-sn-glycerol-3-phosphate acyltransferase [Deltaproteobacteria bacterium]
MRYSLKLFLIILVTFPISFLIVSLALFDRKGKFAYKISWFWTWAILKIGGIRLKIQGLDRLDPSRQYIFMVNHQSNIDIPVLVQSLPKFQLRWLAKRELLIVPLFGWALWASRNVVVDRSNRLKAMGSFRKAKEKIEEGISMVFFPEGTRSPGGQLLPFKRGGFVLAVRTQTPIVPVTINGSRTVLPKGDWRIRGGEIEVIVSEPVSLDQHHPGNLRSLLSHVRGIMESNSRQHADSFSDSSSDAQALVSAEPLAQG